MERQAFEALYEEHAAAICRYVRERSGDAELARDVTSETFLRAWAGRDAIRATTARSYLFTIARNLATDERRRSRKRSPLTEETPARDDGTEHRLDLRSVLARLRELPEDYRDALLLVTAGALSYEDAARVLAVSLATLKIRVYRARLKLTQALMPAMERRR